MLADDRPAAFQSSQFTQTLAEAEGPWLVTGDWWDTRQAWKREVWVVTGQDGALYQLTRHNDQWMLEGTLG